MDSKFFLRLEELSGRCSMSLCADRRFLRDGPASYLTELDRVLTRAAAHPDESAIGLSAAGRPR